MNFISFITTFYSSEANTVLDENSSNDDIEMADEGATERTCLLIKSNEINSDEASVIPIGALINPITEEDRNQTERLPPEKDR